MQFGAVCWVGDLQDARQLTVGDYQSERAIGQRSSGAGANFAFASDRGASDGQSGGGSAGNRQIS